MSNEFDSSDLDSGDSSGPFINPKVFGSRKPAAKKTASQNAKVENNQNEKGSQSESVISESKSQASQDLVHSRLQEAVARVNSQLKVIKGGLGGESKIINFKEAANHISPEPSKVTYAAPTEVVAGAATVVATRTQTTKSFEAGLSLGGDKVSGNIGGGVSKTTDVSSATVAAAAAAGAGAGAASRKPKESAETAGKAKPSEKQIESMQEALKAKGINLDKDSLAVIAGAINEVYSEKDHLEREEALFQLASQLMARMQSDAGFSVPNASVQRGVSGRSPGHERPAVPGGGNSILGEIAAGVGAAVGGAGSFAAGSLKAIGSGLGTLGAMSKNFRSSPDAKDASVSVNQGLASGFDDVAIRPTISSYRADQVEKGVTSYEKALNEFWKVPALEKLHKEIAERARTTGISVQDAMAKMRPGGELQDLHEKFVKEVGSSNEAKDAKVALDKSLKSYMNQVENSSEELLSAELDSNPSHKKAKDRIDQSNKKMQELTGQTPIFEGEEKSHAEALKDRIKEITEKIAEMFKNIKARLTGNHENAAP